MNFPNVPKTNLLPSGVVEIFFIGLIFNHGFLAIVPLASGPYQGDHRYLDLFRNNLAESIGFPKYHFKTHNIFYC
jgi:hypothetical protein